MYLDYLFVSLVQETRSTYSGIFFDFYISKKCSKHQNNPESSIFNRFDNFCKSTNNEILQKTWIKLILSKLEYNFSGHEISSSVTYPNKSTIHSFLRILFNSFTSNQVLSITREYRVIVQSRLFVSSQNSFLCNPHMILNNYYFPLLILHCSLISSCTIFNFQIKIKHYSNY